MRTIAALAALFSSLGAVGDEAARYQKRVTRMRLQRSPTVSFTPFVPQRSQKKRRLIARRLGK